jgi:PAS domain S-box-containing protein
MKKHASGTGSKPAVRRTPHPPSTATAPKKRKGAGPPAPLDLPATLTNLPEKDSPKKHLRVLIVEDLDDDAALMRRELERGGYTIEHERVDTPQALARALESGSWDVVLSDHSMPKFSAPEALARIKEHGIDLPFILVSGSIGEDQAVAVMKAGASDYLRKENLKRLVPIVEREIREAEIRRARVEAEEALRASESLYRTLIETSPDAIVVTDFDTRIRMTNPQALRLLGVKSFAELEGLCWADTFAPAQSDSIRQILDTLHRTERVESAEILLAPLDRPPFPAELSGSVLASRRTKPDAMLFVLRDISPRKAAERQIRQQLERLAALRTIDGAITASLDLRVTLMVILDELTNQLRVDAADVLLLRPNSQTLQYVSDRGFRFPHPKDLSMYINRGYAGQAAVARQVVLIPEWNVRREDPVRAGMFAAEGFSSYAAAPLIAKGQVKGVLEVFHRSRLETDPAWIACLETMAEQAAIAIDNAMLFEDLQRTNIELTLAYDATIEGWSRALDLRDRETVGHAQRVTEATLRTGRALGLTETELIHVRRGCLLHDIGKMAIPDTILLKPGPLDENEWEVMRRHPVYAFEWLSPIGFLRSSLDIPYCHHERWDGNGYPRRLKGEQIPLPARIFAVADTWDSLRTNRPYRKALADSEVFAHIHSREGSSFDPLVLRAFLDLYFP